MSQNSFMHDEEMHNTEHANQSAKPVVEYMQGVFLLKKDQIHAVKHQNLSSLRLVFSTVYSLLSSMLHVTKLANIYI